VISTLFSLPTVLAGAATLTALVTLLYILKVRRRHVALAGASLWQQAQRQVPPRLLGGRWRRPLAWLLSLLIVLLLWLAASGLAWQARDDGRAHVFYLDASAWLLGDGRFQAASEALQRDVAATPGGRNRVVLGADVGALLLAPGESPALLAARLHDAHALALPSAFAQWLSAIAAESGDTVVHYYGAQPAMQAAGVVLGDGERVQAGYLAPPIAINRGIVTLGSAPAQSGRWNTVDVLIGITAKGAALPVGSELQMHLQGAPLSAMPVAGDEADTWWLRDQPADGGLLQVQLKEADAFPADDRASLRLPVRQPLRVVLSAGVPSQVRDAVDVDPSLQVGAADTAQVQIVAADDALQGTLPALRVVDARSGIAAFQFQASSEEEAQLVAARLSALGLEQAGTTALAEELQRPVGVDLTVATARGVSIWADVLTKAHSYTGSPAWPLFVNRSLHWLAAEQGTVPFAAAGTALQQDLLLQGLGQSPQMRSEALGDRLYLPAAGMHTVAGQELAVSLLDRGVSEGISAQLTTQVHAAAPATRVAGASWVTLMLLLALVLAALEWHLYVRGRMP